MGGYSTKLLNSKINFLVIGKTGNGKSSSCNAIAGLSEEKAVFESYGSSTAITKTVGNYKIKRWGKEMNVTDTPGLADPDLDVIGNVKFAKKNMNNAMEICPEGFHAIIIVLNYLSRFTAEEQTVIEVLTEIFGEEMFQFTILIFTHGDSFDNENGINNENISQKEFKVWCQKQEGPLKIVLRKCNFRAVLFHNTKKYDDKRDADMIELKKETEKILQGGKMYTREQFQKNKLRRDHILLNKFLMEFKEEINNSLKSLKEELKLITSQEKTMIERINQVLRSRESHLPVLETLMKDLEDLKVKLQGKKKNQEKRLLYSNVQDEIDTPLFHSLKLLSDDLHKVIKPEGHKETLRHRAKALQNYIQQEDHNTSKLLQEIENIEYFLSELNDLDTKGKGIFTEIE